MKKIPKQEYTAKFKEQAVKRGKGVAVAAGRARVGSGGTDAAQLSEAGRGG